MATYFKYTDILRAANEKYIFGRKEIDEEEKLNFKHQIVELMWKKSIEKGLTKKSFFSKIFKNNILKLK
ncbi:hypothetical protein [Succinivibrio sp.]|uniref:hypothetical protein n=1 Tax=Succinivibrio sp. TaxID=2053619 RepID=UPI0025F18770|nr:hypothetical protein [Succinivibrio sp.]MBQ9219919.1 hypothetical protein [Succinivibrio sp.]